MGIARRPIVKGLLSLPLIALGADWFSRGSGPRDEATEGPEYDAMMAAVQALRMVNTVAARHYEVNLRYPSLAEFQTSQAIHTWLKKSTYPDDAHLYAAMNFTSTELVQGWHCQYKLTKDGVGYLMLLTPVAARIGSKLLPSFATDAVGIIHQGGPNAAMTFGEAQEAHQLIKGHPIRVNHNEPSTLRTVLRSLAVGIVAPVAAQEEEACDGCCNDIYCCLCSQRCYCNSQSDCESTNPGGCRNCGCTCCTWCCGPGEL